MIGVTTFLTDTNQKIEVIFTNYNRPPVGIDIYLSLQDKGNWYMVEDFVLA